MKDLLIMKNSYSTREKVCNYISSVDIADNIKQKNHNTMFNHDYQQFQKRFGLGLDFRLYSSKFLTILLPYDIPLHRTLKYEF